MDYANGKVYKIVCNITGEVYIGSTTQPLSKRLSLHKKKGNTCSSKQIIDRGDYVIVLIEAFPCENKSELFKRERYHFDLIPNINRQRPYRTEDECSKEAISTYQKEWYLENKDSVLTYQKAWYESNAEAVLTKVKAYQEANKEAITTKRKTYREKNKKAISAYNKAIYQAKKTAANQPS